MMARGRVCTQWHSAPVVLLAICSCLISDVSVCRGGDATPLGSSPAPVPVLTWDAGVADFVQALSSGYPAKDSLYLYLRNFRGFLIEQNEVREYYPFLPYIFFDAGSAELPARYQKLDGVALTAKFDERSIPGGTLQKYYQILNILGSRMRTNPTSAITLVGCNSKQPKLGETRELSKQRAEQVREYLVSIWSINPKRIHIDSRDLPKPASDNSDERGREENRRVEIISDDWEVMKIVEQYELRRFPQPEVLKFGMKNGIADEEVASRRIEILRDGKLWHLMKDSVLGLTKPESPKYNWGKWGNEDSIPENESPYVARLIVQSRAGVEYSSAPVEIPVEIITRQEKIRERLTDKTIDRYSLLLFVFNSSHTTALNKQILHDYVCNQIPDSALIQIVGYSEPVEPGGRTFRLSEARAAETERALRACTGNRKGIVMNTKGAGSFSPFYVNELPEGRCMNRTVQIIVEAPTGEWRFSGGGSQ